MELQNINPAAGIQFKGGKFSKQILFQEPGYSVFILTFQAGQELPAHKHPGQVLFVTRLEGEGTVYADGQALEIKRGDFIKVTGEEEFSFLSGENVSSSLYAVLVKQQD